MKPLSYEQIEGLGTLLISLGVTVTKKASTVSMVTEGKEMKVVRQQGWLAVSDADLTPEVQEVIDTYHKGLG